MKTAANMALLLPLVVVMVEGCSSAPSLVGTNVSVPYERSSAFSKLGYEESIVGPDRWRITVGGKPATPKSRMEKIATVRAAEIGVEQRFKYFKIESIALSEKCSPATEGTHKTGPTNEVRTALLTADVTYSKTPLDASYVESKKTFQELRPTLDTEVVVPEVPTTPPTPCS